MATTKIDKALRAAATDAGRRMKAHTNRLVRGVLALKARQVNEMLEVEKAHGKGFSSDATLNIRGKAMWAESYPFKQTSIGVLVQVKRGVWQLVKRGFIAKMTRSGGINGGSPVGTHAGHVGIYKRAGKSRLTVHKARRPRPVDAVREGGNVPEIANVGATAYHKAIERLMPELLEELAIPKRLDRHVFGKTSGSGKGIR